MPVINKANNKLSPSTYNRKWISRDGTQGTLSIIVLPFAISGTKERKYINKINGTIKTNQPVCTLRKNLYNGGTTKENKNGVSTAQCKIDTRIPPYLIRRLSPQPFRQTTKNHHSKTKVLTPDESDLTIEN